MTRTKILGVRDDRYIIGSTTNYQGFIYDTERKVCTPTNTRMKKKWAAVEGVFPGLVHGHSFLDIGSCFGFFCFKALEHGAFFVSGIEMNENFYGPVRDALDKLAVPDIFWHKAKWPVDIKAEIVMAMSVLQYIFPALSLEEFLDKIALSTGVAAIVEFPTRKEPSVIKQGFLDDHPEYTMANFGELARDRFDSLEWLGLGHTNTRHVCLLRK